MHLVPLDGNGTKLFGFSEFLAGLALMVLAWTIADVRYRFRVRTAPVPLQGLTFAIVGAVGVLALLTDLWRAEQWPVPEGGIITPPEWQALLGGLFLMTFLTWAWFAFIRPPLYGKRNAERYARALYRFILKGAPTELSVIADELALSAKALIHYATDRGPAKNFLTPNEVEGYLVPKVTGYANDVLLLIADQRFCRAIVESSPGTALAIFQEIGDTQKYSVQVEIFSKNILNAALAYRDSFMFHEAEGYHSGLLGYLKPLSHAMFSNHAMVEGIGTLLDVDFWEMEKWDAAQWSAYCRVVQTTFRDYVQKGGHGHSYVLARARGHIMHAASDLHKLNGVPSEAWNADVQKRLGAVVEFIEKSIDILDKKEIPKKRLRLRDQRAFAKDQYDYLADMVFEVIFSAAYVTSPTWTCWSIQHNSIWMKLFNFQKSDKAAARIVQFKVRRLLYDEVARMRTFPNFKGARVLGFCLNVMGFRVRNEKSQRDSNALQKAILSWTKKNLAWLYAHNPRIVEACLVEGITYEPENLRLVRTYPAEGLRREPAVHYFQVEPATRESEQGVLPSERNLSRESAACDTC